MEVPGGAAAERPGEVGKHGVLKRGGEMVWENSSAMDGVCCCLCSLVEQLLRKILGLGFGFDSGVSILKEGFGNESGESSEAIFACWVSFHSFTRKKALVSCYWL